MTILALPEDASYAINDISMTPFNYRCSRNPHLSLIGLGEIRWHGFGLAGKRERVWTLSVKAQTPIDIAKPYPDTARLRHFPKS